MSNNMMPNKNDVSWTVMLQPVESDIYKGINCSTCQHGRLVFLDLVSFRLLSTHPSIFLITSAV